MMYITLVVFVYCCIAIAKVSYYPLPFTATHYRLPAIAKVTAVSK
jgi:hypothetical protein